jgi:predicted RNA-binding protein YlxR (DUF448 family)
LVNKSNEPEVLYKWLKLCVHHDLIEQEDNIVEFESFFARQGRKAYLKPLYEEFLKKKLKKQFNILKISKITIILRFRELYKIY